MNYRPIPSLADHIRLGTIAVLEERLQEDAGEPAGVAVTSGPRGGSGVSQEPQEDVLEPDSEVIVPEPGTDTETAPVEAVEPDPLADLDETGQVVATRVMATNPSLTRQAVASIVADVMVYLSVSREG